MFSKRFKKSVKRKTKTFLTKGFDECVSVTINELNI